MPEIRIIAFDTQAPNPSSYTPPPLKVISGNCAQTVWNHYTDPSGRFSAGVWAAETGRWRIRYTEQEFCHILEGEGTITSVSGDQFDYRPGSSFVVPSGFEGTWEVTVPTRKLYAIYEETPPA